LLILTIFLSACSFGYNIVIINDSEQKVELYYKIKADEAFDDPHIKSLEDWKLQKSIRRFWTEEKPWGKLPETNYETNLETRERKITIEPHQVIQIESSNYNPITEEYGDLTSIIELKIKSANGEITYQGKLLLSQFEKDDYTFSKTYRDNLKDRNLK